MAEERCARSSALIHSRRRLAVPKNRLFGAQTDRRQMRRLICFLFPALAQFRIHSASSRPPLELINASGREMRSLAISHPNIRPVERDPLRSGAVGGGKGGVVSNGAGGGADA